MDNKKENKLISVQPEMLLFVDKAELDALEYEQLVEMGRGVGEIKTYANWLLGKLANSVNKKYGDLTKFAKDINQNVNVLSVYVHTYNKYIKEDPDFTPDKYYDRIPWSLIQIAASKSDTPGKLLDDLDVKGATSVAGGYREIKIQQTGIKIPKKPSIRLVWEDDADKWKIKMNFDELPLIDWSDIKKQLLTYLESLS